ncbi:MAG: glycosyltransferase family 2 protein, partial [Bdellovibrionales bacterium]|nr:glycosyltransferase family 2 protein [Bdellovibrionales bacterium]
MNSRQFTCSVVIATFNSEKSLERVLRSVRTQEFDQDLVEILILDGGSRDGTLDIARRFGARVVPNPKTEPVYAKFLALREAKGKFVVYADHDEEMATKDSLRRRIGFLRENPTFRALASSGYVCPQGLPFVNKYINEFGDPFSFFIYRI